jgi:hypothetical protein
LGRTLLIVTERAQQLGESFFGPLINRVVTALDTGFDADERAILRRLLATLAASVQQP